MDKCVEEDIAFSSVRWTWTPSNSSLNFEVNDDGNIVVNEHGTFFIYVQVCVPLFVLRRDMITVFVRETFLFGCSKCSVELASVILVQQF